MYVNTFKMHPALLQKSHIHAIEQQITHNSPILPQKSPVNTL